MPSEKVSVIIWGMNSNTITLTMKEQNKLKVITEVMNGTIKIDEAARLVKKTGRTVFRWQARFRQEGPVSLIHGGRNRVSPRKLSKPLCEEILRLVLEKYADVNDTHLRELLARNHAITIGRETLRSLLRAHGVSPKQKRRSPKWRQRRQRRSQQGMLLQIDASTHDWLEGRGPPLSLIGGIDDADNQVVAVFEDVECTYGYFNMLRRLIEQKGVPLGLYSDRHTIFYCLKEPTLQEQLTGNIPLTQFGRAAKELGIELTKAYSPQAKGRIERLWRIFQDRLVVEMRLENICNKAQANEFLKTYLPRHNAKFSKVAAMRGSCFRNSPSQRVLDQILCLKETRRINRDHTISYNGRMLQIPRKKGLRSLAGREIEVLEYQNGTIKLVFKNQFLATYQPQAEEIVWKLAV